MDVLEQDYKVTVPTVDLEGAKFVFTVGDLIPPMVKANNPEWSAGGLIRSKGSLEYCNGYIRRFEITELRPFFASAVASMVHPEKRDLAVKTYQVSGVNPRTGEFEQKTLGVKRDRDGSLVHDGLLRKQFFPVNEVGQIAQQRDGIVEMPVKNMREKNLAQNFLFPNWLEVKMGLAQLPKQIVNIKAYFVERLKTVQDANGQLADIPNAAFYRAVTLAAIRSCDEYAAWGSADFNSSNAEYDRAKVKGIAWSYPDQAVMLAEQLGLQRKDTVAQNQADQLGTMTDAVAKQAATMDKFLAWQMEKEMKSAPTEELPAKPDINVQMEEFLAETNAQKEVVKCAATTTRTGEKCQLNAIEGGFCRIHSLKPTVKQAEEVTE